MMTAANPTMGAVNTAGRHSRKLAAARAQEVGSTGLVTVGGIIDEEFLTALKGSRGVKAFREMKDNNAVIGASLLLTSSLMRQVEWRVERAKDESEESERAAVFLEENIDDMSHTFADFLGEVISMLPFGWSYFEKVYKQRLGPGNADPGKRSKYSDGMIGWRKLPIRAQESLDRWEIDGDGGIRGMWQVAAPTYIPTFIPIEKSVLFRTELAKNNPEGRSYLRNGWRSWFFLKRLQEFEAIGVERRLVGLPVMHLPMPYLDIDATTEKKQEAEQYYVLLQQIRRNEHEGIVFPPPFDDEGKPTGFELKLLTGGGGGSDGGPSTAEIITRYEKRLAMTLMTSILFVGMDKVGSNSLASSVTTTMAVALGAILDSIQDTFNRFCVSELMELNGFSVDSWPKLVHGDIETPDSTQFAQSLLTLANGGLITPDDDLETFIRETMKYPRMSERDDTEDLALDAGRPDNESDDDVSELEDVPPEGDDDPEAEEEVE